MGERISTVFSILTGGETIYTIEDGMKMIVRETIYIVINE